jgi:leucyl aminopeptidase
MDGDAFAQLKAVLQATCKARDLVNEPHSYLNAPTFSKEVKALGKACGFKVKVIKKKELLKMGFGGLLAVNQGSYVPPTFNIMEWMPEDAKNERPIVLVGKGVMFDTGGVSLKPTKNSMDFMKCDMGGSATVTGVMMAVAKAKLPLKVVALVGATDNRPGKDAYLPGDVVKTLSGITVEILNTDAEGRMTLADSLHYAKHYNPELVLDFATLTGAAAYSIGPEASCYMGNADIKIKSKMEESGYRVHERLVEFPMWKEYGETIKSDIADIKNLGGPYAGMITAGKFLEHFTDYPWLHFDIAGTAYMHKKSGYRTKEGTGTGVRLVFDFLKNY